MNGITPGAELVSLLANARKQGQPIWANDLQLRQSQFPETTWLLDEIVPAGAFVLLVSGPKIGDTELTLPIAIRVARDIGPVWFMATTTAAKRLRQRSMMAQPQTSPEHARLLYTLAWRPETADAAFTMLWENLARARESGYGPVLVVIDSYERMVGRRPQGVDARRFDEDMGRRFRDLCDEYGCTIIVSQRIRAGANPADEDWLTSMAGAHGLVQEADLIWGLSRSRGTRDGVWRSVGDDLEESEIPVTLGQDMVWRPAEGLTVAQASHGGVARLVLDYLGTVGRAPFQEIVGKTGASTNTVHSALRRLADEQVVEWLDGSWGLTQTPQNRVLRLSAESGPALCAPDDGERSGHAGATRQAGPDAGPAGADPAVPADIVAPEPADVADDVDPEHWEETPAGGDNPALRELIRTVLAPSKRSHPLRTLDPEVKEALRDPRTPVCLGGVAAAEWSLKSDPEPGSVVVAFDRKAAFWQGHPHLVPNKLTRRGNSMTWEEIQTLKWSGMFAVYVTEWREPRFPNPWGPRAKPGDRVLVTRDMLRRLHELSEAGMIDFPNISYGFVGKTSEDLLRDWQAYCLRERRAAGSPAELAQHKQWQNEALGSLAKSPTKAPGYIDRADWWHAIRTLHGTQMNRLGVASVTNGEPLIGVGNCDELVYQVPAGADPRTWRPETLASHLDAARFAPKYVMDAETWRLGGWRTDRGGTKSLWRWMSGEWVPGGAQDV